jgi:hypothetical protein
LQQMKIIGWATALARSARAARIDMVVQCGRRTTHARLLSNGSRYGKVLPMLASQLCGIGYLAKISFARLNALSAAASGVIPLLTMSFQAN